MLRLIVLLVLGGGVALAAMVFTRRPSHDRRWALDHARLPRVDIEGSNIRIEGVRRFRQRPSGDLEPAWDTRRYDADQVTSVWLVLTPFSRSWRGPAHSFVSFGFADSSFVAISIEARREMGESYGMLRGLGRSLELIYVIGDEADLIGRRAAAPDHDVYLYPMVTTPARARALFLDMLRRAEALRARPEFYNTLRNNCTTNLVRHVNRIVPGRIPGGLKLLLPGYADEVAVSLGLLEPGTDDIDAMRLRYLVSERARRWLDDPRFSSRIRS